MYSQQLQNYVEEISTLVDVLPNEVKLLNESLACYLNAFALATNAIVEPSADLLSTSLSLLFLSKGLAELDFDVDGSHYLVGMGLEQSGELLSRQYLGESIQLSPPIQNDHWYRFTLALLHYMAGGYRVQALSTLRNLEHIADLAVEGDYGNDYQEAKITLVNLFKGREPSLPFNSWESLLFEPKRPVSSQGQRIFQLTQKIRNRRRIALNELGERNERAWLARRGIEDRGATIFWRRYLNRLDARGIINFTDEQIGPGFDHWLRDDIDLLVDLPTGSGKSIIGELRTAISLSTGKQVIWILPTRSLVRQAKRELSYAFSDLGVSVDELPTTEDFKPLHNERLGQRRLVAATTPEKFAALIRTNREAVSNVGLVVLDEAQILFDTNRGATAEFILQEIQQLVPECKLVLMSAVWEYLDRLRNFIQGLRGGNNIQELVSENRPTRRICGVITNAFIEERNRPIIQIYPPGIQQEDGETEYPYSLTLINQSLPASAGPTAIAQRLLRSLSSSNLRSVTFVGTKISTETQAEEVARRFEKQIQLPEEDLSRLIIELGRTSVIETTSSKKISPHHAGLTTLEQHLVEKWLRKKIINSVVATPTLAQGVNLPFDISILAFLSRFIPSTRGREPISYSEIMNMLGRAGRAGQVSDGVCLIALRSEDASPTNTLDVARRYHFRSHEPTSEYLGLSRLMAIAHNAGVAEMDWLLNLGDMSFSEAQTLVSFSLSATQNSDDLAQSIRERMQLFPSIQDLQELWEDTWDVLDVLISHIEPMVRNLRELCQDDQLLLDALTKTGMPSDYLRTCLTALREDYDVRERSIEQQIEWADNVVRGALESCRGRHWFDDLFSNISLEDVFPAIERWRLGQQLVDIERNWQLKERENSNRIYIGKFFNHTISLIAQFWGALAICEELLFPDANVRYLENMQMYVREGVRSIEQFEWLHRLGGIDRVLAHRMASFTPPGLSRRELTRFVRTQVTRWRNNRNAIPSEIGGDDLGALTSILDEMR